MAPVHYIVPVMLPCLASAVYCMLFHVLFQWRRHIAHACGLASINRLPFTMPCLLYAIHLSSLVTYSVCLASYVLSYVRVAVVFFSAVMLSRSSFLMCETVMKP